MRMSCNGCRVLRKGCSESCVLRPCLQWISTAESQANATIFLAKYYGRTGLANLISSGPEHLRPAIFRSLLYEACGRMVNPIYGSLGLLCSGNWAVCQAAVESILRGDSASQIHPMEAISGKQLSVHARGRFKSQSYSKHKRRKGIDRVPNNYYIGSSSKSDDRSDVTNALHNPDNSIFNEKNIEKHSAIMAAPEQDEFVAATQSQFEYSHDLCSLITSETEAEAPCDAVELELTLGSQRASSPPSPDKFLPGDLRFSDAHWDQYIENFLR